MGTHPDIRNARARPSLVVVAAVGRDGTIGAANQLPWRLRTDLRRYRQITMGKPMIMGRKTFQSIGKALPGRETIVLTRDTSFAAPGILVAGDAEAALALASERARATGADEIILAGGADLYAQLIGWADKLRITEVDLSPGGDAMFPAIDPDLWVELSREPRPAGPDDEAPFTFVDYVRRNRPA